MTLAKGWTIITACPLGGREMLIFYNATSGLGETYALSEAGELTLLAAYSLSVGWTHIVFCNRMLFFYNAANGAGAIGLVNYDGTFGTMRGFPPKTYSLGWNSIASDGRAIVFHRDSDGLMVSGTISFSAPDGVPFFVSSNFNEPVLIATSQNGCSFTATRDQIVAFDPQGGSYLSYFFDIYSTPVFMWSNFSFPWLRIQSATIAVGTRDTLLFINQFGGTSYVGQLAGDTGKFAQTATLTFSPFWSHIVGTDHHLVFYRAYDGAAFTGTITPAGVFVQQQSY